MKVQLYDIKGKSTGELELSKGVFHTALQEDLLHFVVTAQQLNKRENIAHVKDRGEVSGGGKKPWRQKGTGRARHGSIRSPIWIGGGVAFGPSNQKKLKKRIPRKMAKKALLMALASKAQDNALSIIEDVSFPDAKTKHAHEIFSQILTEKKKTLMVLPEYDQGAVRAMRNLEYVYPTFVSQLNAYEVLRFPHMIVTKEALKKIESLYTHS